MTVLYRKYRPQSFEEVVGQRHIVAVLKAALEKNRIAHAYLFSGPRGTGKTTVARIFARAVNCEAKTPCNQCELCREFLSGRTLDLTEIDAASSRGIDEIRALREAVQVVPFRAKYKVFIVDEVHMLTPEAFNALLKTLEEPPAHVIFILATTELDKVPDTIISRAQHFEFRLIPEEEIQRALETILARENLPADQEALGILSALAEGSLRDGMSVLEQVLAYREKFTALEVREILGLPPREVLERLSVALLEKNSKGALGLIHRAADENLDLKAFFRLLLRHFRFSLYLKLEARYEDEFKKFLGKGELDFIKALALKYELPEIENILRELHEAYPLLRIAYLPQLPLELAVLKITSK